MKYLHSSKRPLLFIVLAAALVVVGCNKQDEDGQNKPTVAEPSVDQQPAAKPTVRPKAGEAPTLSSTVSLTVDPKAGFGTESDTIDLSGPAIVVASEYEFGLMFFAPGAEVTCDTTLFNFREPIPGGTALRIVIPDRSEEPKPGFEITGKFELHFTKDGRHTTGGLFDGAKVTLTDVTDTTVTGKLTGSTGSKRIAGGSGTFTSLYCK